MRDFYQGLESALEEQVSGFILGLGPLVKSNEYYLAVNSREIRDKLIMCGAIVVKDRTFKVRSTDATSFELYNFVARAGRGLRWSTIITLTWKRKP